MDGGSADFPCFGLREARAILPVHVRFALLFNYSESNKVSSRLSQFGGTGIKYKQTNKNIDMLFVVPSGHGPQPDFTPLTNPEI